MAKSDLAVAAATVAGVPVGAALLEAAALPIVAIGGAAIMTPRLWSRWRNRRPPPGVSRGPAARPNRALAKTISYRAFATVPEFAANYIVAADLNDALLMSGIGFIAGPIIYWGHEKLWDRTAV